IKKDSTRDEPQKPPVAGDKVKTVDGTIVGEILKIKGPKAGVGTGQIITWVDMTRLLKISQNEYRSHTKTVKSLHGSVPDSVATRRLNFSSRLDVRGMRAEEALQEVSRFLDDAFMTGVGRLEILHGTGTGVLKTEIRKFLKNVPGVVSFQDEHIERGGAGITIVLLE
ncbi:MAG: Smr/MutS family protein, partial [Bacteroidales bacterium]|nr:Smr/MutS family protein [Bacteroidales bacterium]